MRMTMWSGRVPDVRLALSESDDNQGDDDDSSRFCGPRTLLLYPRTQAASPSFPWDVGEGRVLHHLRGRGGPALRSLCSDPTLSGQDSRPGHTGVGGEVTGSGRTLPWLS